MQTEFPVRNTVNKCHFSENEGMEASSSVPHCCGRREGAVLHSAQHKYIQGHLSFSNAQYKAKS